MFLLVMVLSWWVASAKMDSPDVQDIVDDVSWMLKQMSEWTGDETATVRPKKVQARARKPQKGKDTAASTCEDFQNTEERLGLTNETQLQANITKMNSQQIMSVYSSLTSSVNDDMASQMSSSMSSAMDHMNNMLW